MEINIVDAPMGAGKTSAAINFINESDEDTKFLYITPYLTEVDRIIKSCPKRKFKQPESYGTKLNGIKYLFEKGCNIVSTHALFSAFNEELMDLIIANDYILIMDEVANVIEPLSITKFDLDTILEKYATIDDNGMMNWYASEYEGNFEQYKRLCDLHSICKYGEYVFVWLFPVDTFKAFQHIYILTYLFGAQTQKYYFDFYNMQYNYLYVSGNSMNDYQFSNSETNYDTKSYKNLIHVCESDGMNRIGDQDVALSKSWYSRNGKNALMEKLKNNCYNYFRHYSKTKSSLNLWTTFKDYKNTLSGKGYAKGFLSCNVRATNDYRSKIAIAYLVNRYFNPCIKNFFAKNNISIDEDAFALSEMIQFIWRSAIRDGKEIWVYIPSKRMRNLLINWIEENSK